MPTTSRPKTEDKFSRARAAKNSPERQEAVANKVHKDTPPKSVQAKLDAVADSKKKTPRGPSSVKPKSAKERNDKESQQPDLSKKELVPSYKEHLAKNRVRDEARVFNIVHAILSAWKADVGHAEHTAASAGIIKVSRRKIEGALRDLKNTRFTKIPTLINDVLVYNEVCNEFGQWVYVEHDSPDWIFVRLPENSTPVIRANISYDKTGATAVSITTSSEALMEPFDSDEVEVLECNEQDVEDLETKALRIEVVQLGLKTEEAVANMQRPELLKLLTDTI